jgi:biofilm PGA synthesis protein PgaA
VGLWKTECWLAGLVLAAAMLCMMTSAAVAQSATAQRESAVRRARAGDMDGALAALRGMLVTGIDDGQVAFDLTTLLQQSSKNQEAAEVFTKAQQDKAPSYALLAATRANRAIGDYAQAERLARAGRSRFAGDTVWPLTLSLVLSDEKRGHDALEVLDMPTARRASRFEWLMARAYAHRMAGDSFTAMREYGEAARLAPNNTDTHRESADLLGDLGGPFGAAGIAPPTPSIEAAQAGTMVRWGEEVKPRDPVHRFDSTDRALSRLEELLTTTTEPDIKRRLHQDHVIALRDRMRMREAAQEAEALRAEAPLPAYVDEAYGDALLYLHRPEEANAAYERVLAVDPKNDQARYGQFYASVETGDFVTAYRAIDILLQNEPLWRTFVGDPTRYPNPEHMTAEIAAAKGRLYADQLGDAWDRISLLRDAAPANEDVRATTSEIAGARGWPRLQDEEADIAASLSPDDVDAKVAQAEASIANHRYDQAERRVRELMALYPENLAVQRVARELDAEHRWLLELEAKPSWNSGGGVNAPGQEFESSTRLTTPLIADHWKLFGYYDYSFANPIEGFVWRDLAGAGIDWQLEHLRATLYGNDSWGTLQRGGGGITVNWAATDQILLGTKAELFSTDTPLRALFYGITSDEYEVTATYRWHESSNLALTAAFQPFTDGNQRLIGSASFKQKLFEQPRFTITGLVDLGVSSNSRGEQTPYYNPLSDLSATGGVLLEHVLWRRSDYSLTQALQVEGGLYAEQGFNNDWLGVASYEHRWSLAPLTEFHYGIEVSRRVYDGQEVRELAFTLGLRQRL